MGITQKMAHAPIRFSLTAQYLNRWKFDYIDNTDKEYEGDSFVKTLAKHFIIGVDFIPSENFWVGVGFNPKVNMDMKLKGGGSFSGFSLAKYHPSAMSMMISVSTTLADFKKVTE